MKFEKFVKTLGGNGVIYSYGGKKYLASGNVMMVIPDDFRGVVAENITEMPTGLAHYIDMAWKNEPCALIRAELPTGNAGIKDAIRIFENASHLEIRIDNASYTLLDKCDALDIFPEFDSETRTDSAKALVVRKPRNDDNEETDIVGFIFPTAA